MQSCDCKVTKCVSLLEPAVMTVWATSTPSLYGSLVKMATRVPGVPGTGETIDTDTCTLSHLVQVVATEQNYQTNRQTKTSNDVMSSMSELLYSPNCVFPGSVEAV